MVAQQITAYSIGQKKVMKQKGSKPPTKRGATGRVKVPAPVSAKVTGTGAHYTRVMANNNREQHMETPAPKGFTRDGKPRERAYRTYFGVTDAGRVIKYKDYEAREIDVRNGTIKRITAHEARRIEAEGARPSPLVVTTQWSPQAGGTVAPSSQPAAAGGTNPTLLEAQATLNVVTKLVTDLQARIAALSEDKEA
jgi:hypothetical protein